MRKGEWEGKESERESGERVRGKEWEGVRDWEGAS